MLRFNLDRRGQVADTLTWIVATLIIVIILIFFVYISSLLSKEKNVERFGKGIFSEEEGKFDWITTKTNLAYKIDSTNKVLIQNWINENDKK